MFFNQNIIFFNSIKQINYKYLTNILQISQNTYFFIFYKVSMVKTNITDFKFTFLVSLSLMYTHA
jgi:hypothetical protein